jgi:hypothetical protein
VIQRQRLAFVEDRQIWPGVAGQADHIAHRQQAAASGEALPAAASSSPRVVVTMMEAGSPLCWPSFPDASSARSAAFTPSWQYRTAPGLAGAVVVSRQPE